MSALTESPLSYDFGEDFNYSSWDENTVLTLVNVPWNNDYRDIVRFASKSARDAWITDNGYPIPNVSLQKFATNVQIDLPDNAAMQYNYLRASNPLMNDVAGDVQRNYYYFITNVAYLAPNNTELTLQLDVWQTFGYDVSFGSCYIERGHIGIANSHAFDNYGRDYLAVPEGLDVGAEYRIVKTAREQVMGVSATTDDSNYSVLVCAITDLTKDPGSEGAPHLATATGSTVDGITSGASFYVFPTPGDFRKFLTAYSDISWVTQGIISVTIIPKLSRYHSGSTLTDVAPDVFQPLPEGISGPPTAVAPDYVMYRYPSDLPGIKDTALAANWRDTLLNLIPARYRGLKKLLTYPYSVVEITTWTGQPLICRPEAWADDNATIREQSVMMPPGQRIAFIPYRYNGDSNTTASADDDRGEYLDFSTTIDRFPSVPVVNNMAINFLAANNAGLGFSFSNADWSQQRALRSNQTRYEQSTHGMQTEYDVNAIQRQQMLDQASNASAMAAGHGLINAAGQIGSQGVMGGGIAGAGSLLNASVNMAGMTNAAQIAERASGAATGARVGNQGFLRDTNKALADWSARGDYENTIAGINAKIQDARLTQPSTSGQFGGDAMNLAHSHTEVAARWKMLDNSALRTIGNYWLRYGYAVHQFATIPANLQCMSKFTYWKLSETYISQGAFPEGFKQTIRGIFEKGVTVWQTPSDIGTIDWADNAPLDGISY